VARTLLSAIRTLVLPRSFNDAMTRVVFIAVFLLFRIRLRGARTYAQRDQIVALFAPLALLALPPTWLALVLAGYMGMFWALGVATWREAFVLSGSSLLTLGIEQPVGLANIALSFSEAAIGLILVALLIAYLPTMYAAFSRREAAVTLLEVRAGSPPSAVEMILRYDRIHGLERLSELWSAWEVWFAEVEESHTSLAALAFFRSPHPDRSWITAAGAVLDAASLVQSAVDVPRDPRADLCIRAGYLALRRVCDLFRIAYDHNPKSGDPIGVTREEFDEACSRLASSGVPLKPDRDQAWHDFAGWRVNYDTVLLALADLTFAPTAPWSGDRPYWPQRPWFRGRVPPRSV